MAYEVRCKRASVGHAPSKHSPRTWVITHVGDAVHHINRELCFPPVIRDRSVAGGRALSRTA